MNKGFTLLELLVVVGIMGLLGTASVGGYRQMQRGMEERGAKDNASQFIAMVSQRAQIDRRPTAVYCWNELIREETDEENAVVVGKAVAIRCRGRVSLTLAGGREVYDEFGDLEEFDENGEYVDYTGDESTFRLFKFENGTTVKYSTVRPWKYEASDEFYATHDPRSSIQSGSSTQNAAELVLFGYKVEGGEASWNVGDLYGMEFQSFQLPHGYVFGSGGNLPTTASAPVAYVGTLYFDADASTSGGSAVGQATIELASLRPGASGALTAQSIGSTERPKAQLEN